MVFQIDRSAVKRYLDVAQVMIVALEPDERIGLINHAGCTLLGFSEAELLGKNWFDRCLPALDRESTRMVFRRMQKGDSLSSEYFENSVLTRQGEERLISWHNAVLRDPTGCFLGTISSGLDITDRRKADTERSRLLEIVSSRERLALTGELAAGIAHEFRNPLHGGLNCIRMLRSNPGQPPDRELLDLAEEGLRRMDQISARLLSMARSEMGVRRSTDLQRIVQEALAFVSGRAQRQGTRLEMSVAGDLPAVPVDQERIPEALLNLLTNALDACGSGGLIRVTAEHSPRHPGYLELMVADNGPGIPLEIRDQVFKPFFTTKPIGKGSGLGLTLVRKIVEHHGGSVELRDNPGGGIQVVLYLPIEEQSKS